MAHCILRQLECLGYRISIFHLPESLLGRTPARTEMHAVKENEQHVAGTEGHGEEEDYKVACMLAESCGIDLMDG